jgi:hypothetical protein
MRRSLRLHSCYFSKQNFETTVVDQDTLEMLFKGVLLLASWKNDSSTPRLYATVNQSVKFSPIDHASIQDIVRCPTSTASQVSGKVTTLSYNGKNVCCTKPSSIENHVFRRVRSEDANISQDETLGCNSLSIAFVLAPSSCLWWKFPLHFEPFGTCCVKRIKFVLVHSGCSYNCVCGS